MVIIVINEQIDAPDQSRTLLYHCKEQTLYNLLSTLMLDLNALLSRFQGHVLCKLKMCRVLSNHLLKPITTNLSHLLIEALVLLLFICLNHLNLASCILSTIVAIPTLHHISLFLTMYIPVYSHIHLTILVSEGLSYPHLLNVQVLDQPMLHPIQHHRFNNPSIKLTSKSR